MNNYGNTCWITRLPSFARTVLPFCYSVSLSFWHSVIICVQEKCRQFVKMYLQNTILALAGLSADAAHAESRRGAIARAPAAPLQSGPAEESAA